MASSRVRYTGPYAEETLRWEGHEITVKQGAHLPDDIDGQSTARLRDELAERADWTLVDQPKNKEK